MTQPAHGVLSFWRVDSSAVGVVPSVPVAVAGPPVFDSSFRLSSGKRESRSSGVSAMNRSDRTGTGSTSARGSRASDEAKTSAYWQDSKRARWWSIIEKAEFKVRDALVASFRMPSDIVVLDTILCEYQAYLVRHPQGPEPGKCLARRICLFIYNFYNPYL